MCATSSSSASVSTGGRARAPARSASRRRSTPGASAARPGACPPDGARGRRRGLRRRPQVRAAAARPAHRRCGRGRATRQTPSSEPSPAPSHARRSTSRFGPDGGPGAELAEITTLPPTWHGTAGRRWSRSASSSATRPTWATRSSRSVRAPRSCRTPTWPPCAPWPTPWRRGTPTRASTPSASPPTASRSPGPWASTGRRRPGRVRLPAARRRQGRDPGRHPLQARPARRAERALMQRHRSSGGSPAPHRLPRRGQASCAPTTSAGTVRATRIASPARRSRSRRGCSPSPTRSTRSRPSARTARGTSSILPARSSSPSPGAVRPRGRRGLRRGSTTPCSSRSGGDASRPPAPS